MPDKYDVDYSRFADVDDSDDEVEEVYSPALKRQPPPQLQQAMRMMKLGKESQNADLLKRAEALAKEAMELDPNLRNNFEKVQQLHAAGMDPKDIPSAFSESSTVSTSATINQATSVSGRIGELKRQMEAQLEDLKKAESELNGKTDSLEALGHSQNPEDMANFLRNEGLSEEDIDKAMSGDEAAAREVLEKAAGIQTADANNMLAQVESINSAVSLADNISDAKKEHFVGGGKSKQLAELEEQRGKLMEMQRALIQKSEGAAARQAKAEADLASVESAMSKASADVEKAASALSPDDLKGELKGEGWGGGFLGQSETKQRKQKSEERKQARRKQAADAEKAAEATKRKQVQARVQAALSGRAPPAPASKQTQEKAAGANSSSTAPAKTKSISSPKAAAPAPVTPSYTLKRLVSGAVRVVVSLPGLDTIRGLELDISEHEVSLRSAASAAHNYQLKVKFEQQINPDAVKAKFNKSASELRVTLPAAARS